MKKSLFLYLFIMVILINVFTFMYFTKKEAFEITQSEKTITKLKTEIDSLKINVADANYFSLDNNEKAQDYFENKKTGEYFKPEMISFVKDKLLDFNSDPKGNPYTGQDQIGDKKFIINKVKIINHRWIIADFSDGDYWGEVLLKYFINDDKTVSFEVIQSVIYQKQ